MYSIEIILIRLGYTLLKISFPKTQVMILPFSRNVLTSIEDGEQFSSILNKDFIFHALYSKSQQKFRFSKIYIFVQIFYINYNLGNNILEL